MLGRTLTFLAVAGAAATVAAASARADTSWSSAGQLPGPRYLASAVVLHDGRVLVAGGSLGNSPAVADALFWNPQTNQFTATAPLPHARRAAVALTLRDGHVLVAGGA